MNNIEYPIVYTILKFPIKKKVVVVQRQLWDDPPGESDLVAMLYRSNQHVIC